MDGRCSFPLLSIYPSRFSPSICFLHLVPFGPTPDADKAAAERFDFDFLGAAQQQPAGHRFPKSHERA
jgi:hypothetical protein